MSTMKQVLSLQEVEQQGPNEPIWVINNSNNHRRINMLGEIIMTIATRDGVRPTPINIPATWLPTNITNVVPRRFLIEDMELRSAWNNKLILFVTDAYAQYLLNSIGASEELNRLDQIQQAIDKAMVADNLDDGESSVGDEIPGLNERVTSAIISPENIDEYRKKQASNRTSTATEQEFILWMDSIADMSDLGTLNAMRIRKRFTPNQLRTFLKRPENAEKEHTKAAIKRGLAAKK